MAKSWFKMQANGSTATVDIYDYIGMWGVTAKDFKTKLDSLGPVETINLNINSGGGDVLDGWAIYNWLLRHQANVVAQIDGLAASMASIIAMACDQIHIAENSWMMIHNPAAGIYGDSDDLRKYADIMDKMKLDAVAAYSRHSELSAETIAQMMDEETWMNGPEAVEMGFATKITDAINVAASITSCRGENVPEGAKAWFKAIDESEPEIEKQPETEEQIVELQPAEPDAPKDADEAPIDEGANDEPVPATGAEAIAYDEGFAAGLQQSRRELKAQIEKLTGEIEAHLLAAQKSGEESQSALARICEGHATEVATLQARIDKLAGCGLGAVADTSGINGVTTWAQALAEFGGGPNAYAPAKKKYPHLANLKK